MWFPKHQPHVDINITTNITLLNVSGQPCWKVPALVTKDDDENSKQMCLVMLDLSELCLLTLSPDMNFIVGRIWKKLSLSTNLHVPSVVWFGKDFGHGKYTMVRLGLLKHLIKLMEILWSPKRFNCNCRSMTECKLRSPATKWDMLRAHPPPCPPQPSFLSCYIKDTPLHTSRPCGGIECISWRVELSNMDKLYIGWCDWALPLLCSQVCSSVQSALLAAKISVVSQSSTVLLSIPDWVLLCLCLLSLMRAGLWWAIMTKMHVKAIIRQCRQHTDTDSNETYFDLGFL